MTEQELKKAWSDYNTNHSKEIKDKLIIEYSSLVKIVAGRMHMYMYNYIELEDLISYGIFGLIDAIDKFSLTKEVKFETYASLRIRGSILDNIRKMDWIPRSVRQKQKELSDIKNELRHKLDREPTSEEIAKHLGISNEEYIKLENKADAINLVYFDDFKNDDGESSNKVDSITQNTFSTPEESVINGDLKEHLKDALAKLTERERSVILLYYYEELTLKEIGQTLDITESRVSQLHSKALSKMKQSLGEYSDIIYRVV